MGSVYAQRAPMRAASNMPMPEMQTFTIQNGKAFLNGKEVKQGELPKEMQLQGVEMQYVYSEGVVPVIEINDRMFTIEGGRILLMTRQLRNDVEASNFASQKNVIPQFGNQGLRALESTSQVAAFEGGMPVLYQRLRQEQMLELQSQQLAVKIRLTQEGQNRVNMMQELRKTLGMIFDLRMENQREEIQQLNNQLILLRSRLRDKEIERERIIEERLQELIKQD